MKKITSWLWMSEDNLLIDLGAPTDPQILDVIIKIERDINFRRPVWLLDYCYGFGKLGLTINSSLVNVDQVVEWLSFFTKSEGQDDRAASLIVIEACYDPRVAPDLLAVCEHLSLSLDELIQIHSERTYRVLATGFAPGFGYLGETDSRLHMPRKDVPLTRIPPGSLAIAANQTVIYPRELPGGWHLIGRVAQRLVTFTEDSVATLLSLGCSVCFESISYEKFCERVDS